VMAKHRQVLSARSLLPIGLVGSLALFAFAVPLSQSAEWLLFAEVVAYLGLATVFGIRAIAIRTESWSLLPLVLAAFMVCHLSYGVGMVRGLIRAGMLHARIFRPVAEELNA
jgi:hypothetical protein